MQTPLNFRGMLHPTPIVVLLLLNDFLNATSQTCQITSVRQIEDTVAVTYNVFAPANVMPYYVTLRVSADSGNTFPILPRWTKGDVRYGVTPGIDRQILWEPLRDSVELVGTNFVFRVSGEPATITVDSQFVLVRGGSFQMGDTFNEGEADEGPVHNVTLDDFEISPFEVTNYQYTIFLRAYKSDRVVGGEFDGENMIYETACGLHKEDKLWKPEPGFEFYPVIGVTWYGAQEYCRVKGLRLPTEAEWEYVARNGGKHVRFGNGRDVVDPSQMNFNGSEALRTPYSSIGRDRGRTTRITTFPPNRLGIFDMGGNVWQWCLDWYAPDSYVNSWSGNPSGPWFGIYKVIRGGSWYCPPWGVRAAERSFIAPYEARSDIGFRVVRPADEHGSNTSEHVTPDAPYPPGH